MNKTLQNRIVKKLIFAKKGYPIPRSQNDDDDLLEEEIEINEDVVDAVPIVTVKPQIKSAPASTPYFFVGSSHWNTYKGWPTMPDGSKVNNTQPITQKSNASGIKQTIDGIKQYWKGPVAKARMTYMGIPEDQQKKIIDRVSKARWTTVSGTDSSSAQYNDAQDNFQIKINTYSSNVPDSHPKRLGITPTAAAAHELGHVAYPYLTNGASWVSGSNQEYTTRLNKINPTLDKTRYVYNGTKQYKVTPEETTLTHMPTHVYNDFITNSLIHDQHHREFIPFVHETREKMKEDGIWDYQSGEPLTEEALNKFRAKYPQNRLLNYTDQQNALWLLNVIAENNTTPQSQTGTELYYAKKGKKLIPKHQTPANPLVLQNDNTESEINKPTLEEYITSKIEQKKQQAIQKSYDRTTPAVPMVKLHKYTEDYYNKEVIEKKKRISQLKNLLSKYNSAELSYETHSPKGRNYDNLMGELNYLEDYVSYLEHALKNGIEGFSCLYTTTDNYGKQYKCSGNQTFKANPKKFGFTKVQNNEVQPGDIVQVLRQNIPTHAIMFVKNSDSGLPLYNYSDGGKDETAIRKDKQFPLSESLTYTFTGLPSDSAQWKKEYEEIYGHEKGGRLIPKHQTPSQPLVLQNDNTRVAQPVLSVPTTNSIDWVGAANNKIDKIIQSQPHSEIVRHPKRPKSEKEAVTIISDPRKAPQTSSTRVIGLSPVDPIASLFVGLGGFQAPKMLLGIARSPITSGIGLAAGTGGHTLGSAIGETAEKYLGAPEQTSDILGLVGGFAGGYKGTSYAMNSPKIQAIELPFKSNNLKAFNIYGSKRFWHDVKTNPNYMLQARKQGWYPLTIGERRQMIQTLKSKINEGIRYATDRGITLGQTLDDISINHKMTFTGAETAARRHGEGAFLDDNPTQLSFGAFQNDKTGLTFPLRENTKSLLPNWYLAKKPVLIGAHEAQHEVQKYFLQPLTRYREFIPGAYNRYLHPRLDSDVKRAAADIIKSTGQKGQWYGSLSEMDAELVGWMAENNFPKYWSSLNRGQQTFLANRAADRFGGTPEKFIKLFTELELAGY